MSENHDRRHFHRFVLHCPVRIQAGEQSCSARLLDISLKGALLSSDDWHPAPGDGALAEFDLGDTEPFVISAEVEVAHIHEGHIGLKVSSIDLHSASRLRRLVELNLADPALLERELDQLTLGD